MDYNAIYDRLIERSKTRVLEGYKERHHIVPKCMGGSDDKTNLCELTAREHFVAHLLLVKIYPSVPNLMYAVNMMTRKFTPERVNNRMYEWLKVRYSKVNKGKVGTMLGKHHTPETIQKLTEIANERCRGSNHPN